MGGGRGVDWVATQPPLEQPLKNIMRGKKTEIHGSQKPCEANQPHKCSCHRSKCGLSEICGAAPLTNDGVFTFGRLGLVRYFYFLLFLLFVTFQEFAVVLLFLNRHVLGQT